MITITCKQCGKYFKAYLSSKRRFCSQKCYWKFASLFPYPSSFQKGHKGYGTPEGYVKQATKMKIIMKGRYKGERHSPTTEFKKGEHRNVGKNNPMWVNGKSREPYSLTFNYSLKEHIRKRDSYICQKCNKTQEENGRRLDVHHIDYDKQNCDPSNLISLCHVCNLKANQNRPYWTTFFLANLSSRNLLNQVYTDKRIL